MPRSGFGLYCDEVGGCSAGASPADPRGGTGVALGVHYHRGPIVSNDKLFIPAILRRRFRAISVAMERHKNVQIKLVSTESLTLIASRRTLRSSVDVPCI